MMNWLKKAHYSEKWPWKLNLKIKKLAVTLGRLIKGKVFTFIKKLVTKNFLPHELLYLKHSFFELLGREPIIIYTMGKVGSTTVYHAFKDQFFFPLTYHVHHLTDESYHRFSNQSKENGETVRSRINLLKLLRGSSSDMTASQILRKASFENSKRNWKIVTLVRDPFSTYLSHIFQNPQITRPFLLDINGLIDKRKVENYINQTFSDFKPEKDYISNWFDKEFYKFTGVDLYQHSFNTEKGYSIIDENNFNIAIISLESLEENLPLVIHEFTNSTNEISIEKKNVRSKKDQNGIYQEIKNEIEVPKEGLEKFYSTKYAKHFFTEEFRNEMINKWSGKS